MKKLLNHETLIINLIICNFFNIIIVLTTILASTLQNIKTSLYSLDDDYEISRFQ